MNWRVFVLFLLVFGLGVIVGQTFDVAGFEDRGRVPVSGSTQPADLSTPAVQVAMTTNPPLPEGLTEDEKRNIRIFRRASDAAVFITSLEYQRSFFSLNVFETPTGSGSGFVWDKAGHVVTNYHVVARGDRFTVTLGDGTTYDAKVVGNDPNKDLAVLKIEAPPEELHPLPLGRSADLAVGQTVLAVGNPFGLDQTLTVGVISALGREITSPIGRTIRDVIQTDAAINPGNSGGPLLDSSGRVIGINSKIVSPSGASAGIGFAVPVDTVSRMVPQLIAHGRPIEPKLGVVLLPDHLARRNGLEGVVIREVAEDSPAERAGLRGWNQTRRGWIVEDQIVEVDGTKINTALELQDAFDAAGGVGARVTLTILNGGDLRKVDVVLEGNLR